MADRDPAEVEARLNAGEWLKVGDLMVLFGRGGKPVSRSSVNRWLTKGATFGTTRIVIRYRIEPSGDRIAHPEDIARVLAESRKVRSGEHPEGEPGEPSRTS